MVARRNKRSPCSREVIVVVLMESSMFVVRVLLLWWSLQIPGFEWGVKDTSDSQSTSFTWMIPAELWRPSYEGYDTRGHRWTSDVIWAMSLDFRDSRALSYFTEYSLFIIYLQTNRYLSFQSEDLNCHVWLSILGTWPRKVQGEKGPICFYGEKCTMINFVRSFFCCCPGCCKRLM
jgi:hypothetical protein